MDLIRRCKAGDQEAFAKLYDQYKLLVYRAANLMLNDPQDAEDVLQDVFVRVYRSLASYDRSKGAFTTWLHRITVNTCLNRHRDRGRRPRLLRFGDIDQEQAIRTPSFVEGIAEDQVLRQALDGLSDKLRVVVILHYGLEMSYAEISQVLDLPLGTVKSRAHEALNILRTRLGSEDAVLSGVLPCGEGNSQ
ncbi:MAG: RNA polymerase sigma factor [Anaerolineae bacterium]|nr:RNA polymerase sigma factor [Anaerolineae bacterium]